MIANYIQQSVPAEFDKHYATIAMFPFRGDVWRNEAKPIQQYILSLIDIVSRYECVYLICRPQDIKILKNLNLENVTVLPIEIDDAWARDTSPTFTYIDGNLQCIDWRFNSWGGIKHGSYYPWNADDEFASKLAKYFNLESKRSNIVLEGGALLSDGNGTLFSTQSVLLSRTRNPFKSKQFVEDNVLSFTRSTRMVWLKQGLAYDETNGHIDNIMCIASRHELCLAWTDDKTNPNYTRLHKAYDTLSNLCSIDGEKYIVHRIPLPPIMTMTSHEAEGVRSSTNALLRREGDILPASYLNCYILNGAVIIPAFNCPQDVEVYKQFRSIFPNREVVQLYSREPLLGGGGIHCLLHEIPYDDSFLKIDF